MYSNRTSYFQKVILIVLGMCCMVSKSLCQSEDFYDLPDCNSIEIIPMNTEEIDSELLRFKRFNTNDTLESLYCIAKQTRNKELEAASIYRLGLDYKEDSNHNLASFERMIKYAERAIQISREEHLPYQLMASLEVLISSFTSNRIFSQAELYTDEFIQTALNLQDSTKISEGYMLKGRIFRDEGKYNKADSMLNLSLSYFNPVQRDAHRVAAYTNLHLSNSKRIQKQYEESIHYAQKGLDKAFLASDHKDFVRSLLAFELILSNIELGNYELDKYLQYLKKYSDNYDSNWMRSHYYFALGNIDNAQGQYEKAIDQYIKAVEHSYQAGTRLNTIDVNKKLIPLLLTYDTSKEKLTKVLQINQKTIDETIKHTGSENLFQITYYKLKNQENENRLLTSKISHSKKINWLFITVIILLLAFGSLLLNQYRNKRNYNTILTKYVNDLKQSNNQLQVLNEKNQNQRQELEIELKQQIVLLASMRNQNKRLETAIQKRKDLPIDYKKKLLDILNFDMNQDTIENINIKFLEMNKDFLQDLSQKYPQLTNNDLNLALFLKMNLTTKEIAQIQYKSVNTIKVARSRLRKKLKLDDTKTKLSAFFNGYDVENSNHELGNKDGLAVSA